MKHIFVLIATALAASLTACGGGNSDASSSAAVAASDRFVGVWMHCEPISGAANGVVSSRKAYIFTKQTATNLSFSINAAGFLVANCGGTNFNNAPGIEIATGTMTLNETKIIGSQIVDRLNVNTVSTTAGLNGAYKDISLVSATTMTFGIGLNDSEGYPTQLHDSYVYTKQLPK